MKYFKTISILIFTISFIVSCNSPERSIGMTTWTDDGTEYKYYLDLDSTSVVHLSTTYGDIPDYIGWENSPQFGGANRTFQLGSDDGTGLLELPMEGYYDLPPGGVVPCCRTVTLTFNIDMVGADSLGFLSMENLLTSVNSEDNDYCGACFTGEYPIPIQLDFDKFHLEKIKEKK